MHAIEVVDVQGFAVVRGGAFDEAVRQRAEAARGAVGHQQRAVRVVVEAEGGYIGAWIDLADFGMDDGVDAEDEGASR
ncbi:hypothetical protein D3C81_1680040 [compost metagenome]